MPFPNQVIATTISDRLNVLADQLKTRTRANLNDANHWLESVMARFFNALMGWDLVNLNAEQSNFPAADLGDKDRRIAIQITNQDDPGKITETAFKATKHSLGKDFDKLIIFFLLPKKPMLPKKFEQPTNGPVIDCWDLADLLKQMSELPDQSRLKAAATVLAKDLGISDDGERVYPSNLPGMYAGSPFLGREDFLRDLRASLLKRTHATAITHTAAATGIAGLGGIGKTHAAVKYALNYQANYTATLFVSGDSSDRLDAGFSALFDTLRLGTPGEVQRNQALRITAVKHWFASHSDWLLIVDNVDDKDAAAALTGYFGDLSQGHVLITSRLQNWGSNVEALNIEVLSPEDSTDLLLQLTQDKRRRTDDEATQARRLADLLEGLPLALHQAAGYINEQSLTFTGYITEYEEEAKSLLDWFESHIIPYERPDMLAPRPVLITWKTSFEKLDPDTRFWLLVFSHFAPDPIPEFLLDSAQDASDEVKTIHRAAKKALAQAETYSLLTRYDGPPRFKLHRLVQQFIRLTASEPDCAAAIIIGIWLFEGNYPGDPTDVLTWRRWNPLQAHAVALCDHAPDAPAPERLSWLLGCVALLLKTKSLYARAEPHYRRALDLDEACYGSDEPKVATRLNNLAQLLQDTNRLKEAEPMMRRVLSIDETHYGPDHPNVASDLNNLGTLLKVTGRLAEAEPLYKRALAISEAHDGKDHASVARHLNNLAQLLQDTNRLAEAEPLMWRVLSIDEAHYGRDHPEVATDLNNLARLLKATKRWEAAEPLYRRALGIDEALYGPNHPRVANDLNNLAALLQATKRLAEAESLYMRALGIDETSYGPDHPLVASRLNNLATLFHDTNRRDEAEPLMRRALGIYVSSMGLEHPDSQTVRDNYIELLQDMDLPEAEIEQRVQAVVSESRGPSTE